MAFGWGRRTVANVCRQLDDRGQTHRTRFNNFLTVGRFDPAEALRLKAAELVAQLKLQPRETVYLVIDDSKKAKRGKHMDAVGWIHDPLSGRTVRGHQYVTAVLVVRGYCIPYAIHLYVKQELCRKLKVQFQTLTRIAADMIRALRLPGDPDVCVLFDSFYLCPVVVRACQDRNFAFVSALKSNRNLREDTGPIVKVSRHARTCFRRGPQLACTVRKPHASVTYTIVDASRLLVSKLGPLHVIYSRKNKEKRILGLVTNHPRWSAIHIVKAYAQRWRIEVFFKDAKQLLGLGHYQNLAYQAAVTHLHLVCFAHALLTHLAIAGDGAQGKSIPPAATASTETLQTRLRALVWNDTADHLRKFKDPKRLLAELDRLLAA